MAVSDHSEPRGGFLGGAALNPAGFAWLVLAIVSALKLTNLWRYLSVIRSTWAWVNGVLSRTARWIAGSNLLSRSSRWRATTDGVSF